jgi:hypothetical protein
MLTGTRNIMALILLSGFLFTNWNYCAEVYTPAIVKIETDVFKYGLIYYSAGTTENWIDIEPAVKTGSFRQLYEKKFIIKTRRTGNKFYHQYYKNPLNESVVDHISLSSFPLTLINPGKIALPFSPFLAP